MCDADNEQCRDRLQGNRQVRGRWGGHDERVDVRQSRAPSGEAPDRRKAYTSRRGHSSRLSTTAPDETRSVAYRTETCLDPHRPTPMTARTHDVHSEVLVCSHEPSSDMSHPRSAEREFDPHCAAVTARQFRLSGRAMAREPCRPMSR